MNRPTRESLLEKLQAVAAEHGPDVTVFQFRQLTGITAYAINNRWGNWTNLRKAAGLPVRAHAGLVYSNDELWSEYHRVAAEVNDYPSHADFNRLSDRCFYTLETRFGNTEQIRQQYREWLAAHCPGESPKFLEGCPEGFEPTVLPGLDIIDGAWLRRGVIGLGVWLLSVLTTFIAAGVMVFAWPMMSPANLLCDGRVENGSRQNTFGLIRREFPWAMERRVKDVTLVSHAPSPPSAGGRAGVRGRMVHKASPLPDSQRNRGRVTRGGICQSRRLPARPLTLTLSPADGGEGTGAVTHDRTNLALHQREPASRNSTTCAGRPATRPMTSLILTGDQTMPLLPPPTFEEPPSDLVIDVFGTFLGKRSERMVVRWRDADRTIKPERTVPIVDASETIVETSDDAIVSPVGEQKPHPADRAAAELLSLWATTEPTITPIRPSPPARLVEQLDRVAEPPPSPRTLGEWQERVVPLSRLKSVTVSGRGVTVSSDLIEALVERGIALSFLSGRGQPVAQLSAPGLGGTVQTRRSQLAAYTSPLGVQLAVEFIRGKLRNQKHLLQYTGKYLKEKSPARYERLERKITAIGNIRKQLADFEADELDPVRDKLMGFEGTGARLYWEGFGITLEERMEFPGRMTRGAIDPINSALNYGYGILYGKVSGAVVNAGLELYAGFLHVDRPGKPALVLDMVEEFRAPVVDRAVLAIVNQGIVLETDDHGLTASSRRLVADRVLERLSTPVPYEGKRWPLTSVIQHQARHLAVAVRGERIYRAFASRW